MSDPPLHAYVLVAPARRLLCCDFEFALSSSCVQTWLSLVVPITSCIIQIIRRIILTTLQIANKLTKVIQVLQTIIKKTMWIWKPL
uniref:Uncharacterized protein n=1 Tax=Knipowitschia caucasica TaxID=637954 RepID=A0AAV2MBR6_KNICA